MLLQEEEQSRNEQTKQNCVDNRLRLRLSKEWNVDFLFLWLMREKRCDFRNDFESVIGKTSGGRSTVKARQQMNRLKEMYVPLSS